MSITLPGDMTRAELESPGVALARQARTEAAVEALFTRVLRRFLADALAVAQRDGATTMPAPIFDGWAAAISVERERSDLPDVVLDYAIEALTYSDVPQIAYDSIRSVTTAAAVEGWPTRVTNDQLRIALSPDAGQTTPAITAAAYPRNGAAWEGLDQGGLNFMDRMKRDARTAVTGLDGILTGVALRDQGFTRKRWVTKRDSKVRETHAEAEGQTVELDEPFIVGGYPLMHPGERPAPPAIVINCRCVMVGTRWRARRTY